MSEIPGTVGRAVVGDVETTGLDPETGDKIVEVGFVEIHNMIPTGRYLHIYVNPERPIPADATAIHGITDERVRGCETFPRIAEEVARFVGKDFFIAHNARFDAKFLNAEMVSAGRSDLVIPDAQVLDSLEIFKRKFPGSPSTLDALCRRFGVDNGKRDLHGALLDSDLLAKVWLALNGGAQIAMSMEKERDRGAGRGAMGPARQRPTPLGSLLLPEEAERHGLWLKKSGIAPDLWSGKMPADPDASPDADMEGP